MHHRKLRSVLILAAVIFAITAKPGAAQPTPAASSVQTASAPSGITSITDAAKGSASQGSTASNWEAKDTVLAVGLAITLFLGVMNAIANFRLSRRTTFINTVTSQRIKWIEQLRQDVSSYAGLTFHWVSTDIEKVEKRQELLQEIDRLQHVIRLRLNPTGEEDKNIAQCLSEIPKHTDHPEVIGKLLEQLTSATQRLLKEEWDKVKLESQHGPLSARA